MLETLKFMVQTKYDGLLTPDRREVVKWTLSEIARLEEMVYVPGLWRCAKCDCRTMRTEIRVADGAIRPLSDESQQCPNKCGPMQRVTERDAGNALAEKMGDVGAQIASLQRQLGHMERERDASSMFSPLPPMEQGWYWHWNGSDESAPIPTSVLWSGSDKKCFVAAGQLGLSQFCNCDEYGGFWLKMQIPLPIPMSESDAARRQIRPEDHADPFGFKKCEHPDCGRFHDENARRMSCRALANDACPHWHARAEAGSSNEE